MSAKKADVTQDEELSFEDALARLEESVHQLEDGELGLGESLERYQQCVSLLRRCHQQLEQATRQVELLQDVGTDGEAHTVPFDDDDMPLDEKQQSRAQRRGAASKDASSDEAGKDDVDDEPGLF